MKRNVLESFLDCYHKRWLVGWLAGWLAGWLVGCLGLWHINLCSLFKAKSIFMKIVLFQTIQFRMSTQFKFKYNLTMKKHFYFKLFSLVR